VDKFENSLMNIQNNLRGSINIEKVRNKGRRNQEEKKIIIFNHKLIMNEEI